MVAASDTEHSDAQVTATRGLGVRARLLLAFFGIALFAALAAVAAMYAFREVGERLQAVDARVAPTVSALELSRSAERIIAAAPALLAANERTRRDELRDELSEEVNRLNSRLQALRNDGAQVSPLESIERDSTALTTSLRELDELVTRRLKVHERIGTLRREMFQVSAQVQRLLAPWLEVMSQEISKQIADGASDPVAPPHEKRLPLTELVTLQRLTQAAQRQVSATVDMLVEASTSEQLQRLSILDFQLDLALDDIATTSNRLDPRLQPVFREHVAALRQFVEGHKAITEARRNELALLDEGEEQLARTAELSASLTAALDRLGSAAEQDIGDAISEALRVQHLSTRALIVLVALSLVTSVLIVWLYVGGNIVRRLTALSDGMLAIAGGKLLTPVTVSGKDEIAAMARAVDVFRRNAIELERLLEERRETAGRLERQVQARTRELVEKSRQLESANQYKSHFLASASHDLRQPLHALNLFVAQLRTETRTTKRDRLVARIDAAVNAMNELFEALLDMSRLEAGILEPHLSDFPIQRVLERIEATFGDTAAQKALGLSVVPSSVQVRSDPVLLERILMNLVSNAVHHTSHGGIVVGCRRRGGRLRIDVCDSGPGIPKAQQQNIFGEYFHLEDSGPEPAGGFGLGLAIVDRLGRLLDHDIGLDSRPGRGSRFSVTVPRSASGLDVAGTHTAPEIVDPVRGKLVVVIDDDPFVVEGMDGLLSNWGALLVSADSGETALVELSKLDQRPDLIIADYRLANGMTGVQAIERLRRELGSTLPAFLISGDTAPERLRDAQERGIHLLHKPVPPMQLRAMITRLLKPVPHL